MVARITSPGNRQKFLVERSHQHHGPFDQARDLVEQHLVLDQLKALRERQLLGVGENGVLAALGIEHDLRLLQLRLIILEAAHGIGAGAMKRWP